MKKLSELEDLGVSEISEESKIKMPTPTNRDVRKESLAAAVYLNYFQKSHDEKLIDIWFRNYLPMFKDN